MKIIRSILSSFVVVFALLTILAVTSASADVLGSMSFIDGRVDILTSGLDRALPVESGAPVSAGDVIRTKSGARAEIALADGTVLRLAESTRIEITNAGSLDLLRGRLRTLNPATPGFVIQTPNGQATLNGNDFYSIHEKGSTWFYGNGGSLQASSKADPNKSFAIDALNCVRIASGVPMLGSCVYQEIDVEKYAWDTSKNENNPVVAKLPTEGGVYTYTPLGGRAVDTPSMPVTVQNQDLVCTQCAPDFRVEQGPVPDSIPDPIPVQKFVGNFKEITPPGYGQP